MEKFYKEDSFSKKTEIIKIINNEIEMINVWKNFTYENSINNQLKYPEIPHILDPQLSMSLAWNRHNQLNSHLFYNPLFALVYQWALTKIEKDFKCYGFPKKSCVNPLKIVLGDDYEGAEYEFSLVFWNEKQKKLYIFESSSVINFKHTSDKCKELCARIRIVRGILFSHCVTNFYLIVDGDWREQNILDLQMAGWDEVIYSRDFIENIFDWNK